MNDKKNLYPEKYHELYNQLPSSNSSSESWYEYCETLKRLIHKLVEEVEAKNTNERRLRKDIKNKDRAIVNYKKIIMKCEKENDLLNTKFIIIIKNEVRGLINRAFRKRGKNHKNKK